MFSRMIFPLKSFSDVFFPLSVRKEAVGAGTGKEEIRNVSGASLLLTVIAPVVWAFGTDSGNKKRSRKIHRFIICFSLFPDRFFKYKEKG